jgi:plastocyanin
MPFLTPMRLRPRSLHALTPALLLAFAPAARAADVDVRGKAWIGSRPCANAVVWIEVPGAPKKAQGKTAVMDQKDLTFIPHVLAVQVGTKIRFPNHDRVFHNVYSYRDGKKFDLGTYAAGTSETREFDKPGLSRLSCNIHTQMSAYIWSVETPYFAVSGKNGEFAIPDVPAGEYTYSRWRPGMRKPETGTVTIAPGKQFEVRFP